MIEYIKTHTLKREENATKLQSEESKSGLTPSSSDGQQNWKNKVKGWA